MKTVFAVEHHDDGVVSFATADASGIRFTEDGDEAITFADRHSAKAFASMLESADVHIQDYVIDDADEADAPRVWMYHGESDCLFCGPEYDPGDGLVNEASVATAMLRVLQGANISPEHMLLLLIDRNKLCDAGTYKAIEKWQVRNG